MPSTKHTNTRTCSRSALKQFSQFLKISFSLVLHFVLSWLMSGVHAIEWNVHFFECLRSHVDVNISYRRTVFTNSQLNVSKSNFLPFDGKFLKIFFLHSQTKRRRRTSDRERMKLKKKLPSGESRELKLWKSREQTVKQIRNKSQCEATFIVYSVLFSVHRSHFSSFSACFFCADIHNLNGILYSLAAIHSFMRWAQSAHRFFLFLFFSFLVYSSLFASHRK